MVIRDQRPEPVAPRGESKAGAKARLSQIGAVEPQRRAEQSGEGGMTRPKSCTRPGVSRAFFNRDGGARVSRTRLNRASKDRDRGPRQPWQRRRIGYLLLPTKILQLTTSFSLYDYHAT